MTPPEISDAPDALHIEPPIGSMRTRDVLRWHWSLGDMAHLAAIVLGGLALGILDAGATALERWIDGR